MLGPILEMLCSLDITICEIKYFNCGVYFAKRAFFYNSYLILCTNNRSHLLPKQMILIWVQSPRHKHHAIRQYLIVNTLNWLSYQHQRFLSIQGFICIKVIFNNNFFVLFCISDPNDPNTILVNWEYVWNRPQSLLKSLYSLLDSHHTTCTIKYDQKPFPAIMLFYPATIEDKILFKVLKWRPRGTC